MAWVPAKDDMPVGTRLNELGGVAAADNIIRTEAASAGVFPENRRRLTESFQPDIVDPK
jgi:hypothetical protein